MVQGALVPEAPIVFCPICFFIFFPSLYKLGTSSPKYLSECFLGTEILSQIVIGSLRF